MCRTIKRIAASNLLPGRRLANFFSAKVGFATWLGDEALLAQENSLVRMGAVPLFLVLTPEQAHPGFDRRVIRFHIPGNLARHRDPAYILRLGPLDASDANKESPQPNLQHAGVRLHAAADVLG